MLVSQPGHHTNQRVESRTGWRRRIEVTNDTHQLGIALIAPCGIAANRPGDGTLATFPYATLRVDNEVVGNIVPSSVRSGVKVEPGPENPGHVGCNMPVPRCRVVDYQEPNILGFERTFRRMS